MIHLFPCSFIRFYLWDVSRFSVFLLFGVLNFALSLSLCTTDFLFLSYSALCWTVTICNVISTSLW